MSSASSSAGAEAAIVALGSNLGDSKNLLREAMARLRKYSTRPLLCSSLWRSTPVDCPPGSPEFINAAAALWPPPELTPEALLRSLQALEKEFGRRPKTVMNEARPLDLDLITFGREIRDTPELILPHPRAHLRRFVMEPVAELFPELVLPGWDKKISGLLSELKSPETVVKISA
jgi:2-amino-4-hydroxy-6-hydroxymethyldihydropteridine diphosphokinase